MSLELRFYALVAANVLSAIWNGILIAFHPSASTFYGLGWLVAANTVLVVVLLIRREDWRVER